MLMAALQKTAISHLSKSTLQGVDFWQGRCNSSLLTVSTLLHFHRMTGQPFLKGCCELGSFFSYVEPSIKNTNVTCIQSLHWCHCILFDNAKIAKELRKSRHIPISLYITFAKNSFLHKSSTTSMAFVYCW